MTLRTYTRTLIFPRRSLRALQNNSIVLGVDPGLATTGWGVIEKTSADLTLKAFGAILSPSTQPLPARLHQIRQDLSRIIEEHHPSVLAIEELFFAKFAVS